MVCPDLCAYREEAINGFVMTAAQSGCSAYISTALSAAERSMAADAAGAVSGDRPTVRVLVTALADR